MTTNCRYLVMTTGGKPVFVYPDNHNDDELDTTRLCGLVQALRVSTHQTLRQQEMHCLQTKQSTQVVWMTCESFTFMVIVNNSNNSELSVAFWRAKLERLYLAMIMMFTLQIQIMLTNNPQLNVESLWNDKQPEQLLALESDYSSMMWGIPSCFVSSQAWRRDLAACLVQSAHDSLSKHAIGRPWMALVAARSNNINNSSYYPLITYVASTAFPGFATSDGILLWNWLQHQLSVDPAKREQSSFPICFPQFHAEGYLYASLYSMLDPFTLIVLHPHEDTDASFLAESLRIQTRQFAEEFRSNHLEEQWVWEEYLDLSQAWHFLFRLHHHSSSFAQCIESPVEEIRKHSIQREEVCNMYHQLAWRLRLGSTSVESTLNKVLEEESSTKETAHHSSHPTVACPLLQCMDAPPLVQGVTYVTQGPTTYLAMSGRDFELYLTTSSSILPEEVAALGAKLTRRLLHDQAKWFVVKPPTFFLEETFV